MFNIKYDLDSQKVSMSGQFEASKVKECKDILDNINETFTIDMSELDFICSAGIGILVLTYSRLKDSGNKMVLTNLNSNISTVFKISLLDTVFDIQ
jgi:anti-sigma B factor antagonist